MESLRVLVVDDEAGMRLGVERTLRDFTVSVPDVNGDVGFQILQAGTGEEALQIVESQRPEILLLDHKLPGLSGLDILDRLADHQIERGGDLLTVMITAYATLETAVTATKRGAYDFLAKPFTPEELRGVIRKAARHVVLQRQARRLAEEKRQVRFQFISVVAHELKAPLAAIEGFLRIISEHSAGNDPAVYEHMIQRSLVRTEGMRKLIEDLLDLTRIESGRRKRELVPLDLSAVAKEVVENFAPRAVEAQLTLQLHASEPLPLTADRGEIDVILNNLLSNAIKYNRPGGRVDVRLEKAEGGGVRIAVKDTGIGMTPDEVKRLFGEFVRIKNEKTRNIPGSGLGLAIVSKLASVYRGEVTVKSEPDRGSTFTVLLQRGDEPAAGEAPRT